MKDNAGQNVKNIQKNNRAMQGKKFEKQDNAGQKLKNRTMEDKN